MGDRRAESRFERNVWIAWGTWALSLILPAVVFTGLPGGSSLSFPGWQAAAICALSPAEVTGKTMQGHGVLAIFVRAMSLTNVVMALGPLVLVFRRPSVQAAFRALALGAAGLDVLALICFHAALSIGYVVWLASFLILGVTLSRDRGARRLF